MSRSRVIRGLDIVVCATLLLFAIGVASARGASLTTGPASAEASRPVSVQS